LPAPHGNRRPRIVTAEGFDLGKDDALRGGHIVGGAGRGSEAEQKCGQQEEGAHQGLPGSWFSLHGSQPKA